MTLAGPTEEARQLLLVGLGLGLRLGALVADADKSCVGSLLAQRRECLELLLLGRDGARLLVRRCGGQREGGTKVAGRLGLEVLGLCDDTGSVSMARNVDSNTEARPRTLESPFFGFFAFLGKTTRRAL